MSGDVGFFNSAAPNESGRIMTSHWIDPSSCRSLAVLVESVVAPLLIQHASPVCLELDIDTALEVPADSDKTVEMLLGLVRLSLSVMPEVCFFSVSACESASGFVLLLADTGCVVDESLNRLPLSAAAIGASLTW